MSKKNLNPKKIYSATVLEIKDYTELKNKVLSNIPNLPLMAKNFMQQHIMQLTGQSIDPDRTYLHLFKFSEGSNKTYNGWNQYEPISSLTLTELAFKNFDAADSGRPENTLNSRYGVFKDGPGKQHYGTENEVRILASHLRKILNENDFYALVKNSLNTFWEKHEADMLALAKATFISMARRAMLEGILSEDDYKFVMKTTVPNLPLEGPVSLKELMTKSYSQECVYSIDINGYSSNDILRFGKNNSREILYIPGERRPFEVFENDAEMRSWIVEQSQDSKKRSRLEKHFSLYDRQDGIFYTGVDNALLDLASGSWSKSGSGIDKYEDNSFTGDVFSAVLKKTKERSFKDADSEIKSNAEVSWDQWLGYITVANNIFGPVFGLVGGALGTVLAAGAFAAQIGMEVRQAITGDTEEERKQRFWSVGIDIGTILLFAGFGKFTEIKAEISELNELPEKIPADSAKFHDQTDNDAIDSLRELNKKIIEEKIAEDNDRRGISMRLNPKTGKITGRKYYRVEDDTLKSVPLTLGERLYKIRTEGLSGRGSMEASRQMAINDMIEKLRSEPSIEKRQIFFNNLLALHHGNLNRISSILLNLGGLNMEGIQLREAHLTYSYLDNTNLNDVNLQDANLQGSDFSRSLLRNANLQKADLTKCILKHVDLRSARLESAILENVNLKKACLDSATLECANLKGSSLIKASMKSADLKNTNLENVDLVEANLENANLTGASLEDADLQFTNMSYSSVKSANLKNAFLAYSNLSEVNFSEANLEGSILNYSNLENADFRDAILKGTQIEDAYLVGASFEGATLDDNTSISFKLPEQWNLDELDTYLNHITNNDTGSILTALDSIDNNYFNVKINLANDLINSLREGNADITSVAEALIDILSNEVYQADHNISSFMQEVCHRYLARYSTNILLEPRESIVNAAINFFDRNLSLTVSGEFNAAFIQYIQDAINIYEMEEEAIELYNKYLSQDPIRQLLTRETELKLCFGNFLGQPDWLDVDSNNYILLSPINNQRSMILSSSNLTKMRNPQETISWNNFYLFDNGNTLRIQDLNLEEVFTEQFPLFSGPYYYASRSVGFKKLLNLLELGEELNQKFLSALNHRIITDINAKMISYDYQTELSEIFNEKIDFDGDSSPFLKEENYNQILRVYDLTNASEQERAENLLSLSAGFSRYSSSEVFGIESNSPLALRHYSSALMRKAHELKPEIFVENNADQFFDWNNRLLGRNGAFTCTAVLSDMMIEHAKAKFPNVINSMLPPAWL